MWQVFAISKTLRKTNVMSSPNKSLSLELVGCYMQNRLNDMVMDAH